MDTTQAYEWNELEKKKWKIKEEERVTKSLPSWTILVPHRGVKKES